MSATSAVDDLQRYFESLYREGGEFQSEEYEDSKDLDHSWKHLRTGIVVWKDAIDLSGGPGAKAFSLHGEEYVKRVYPPRASFCIPLLIDPENAYDISVRPMPEMQAAGKPPRMNLGDKLLNEPGQPERRCVVFQNARARLSDALRAREAAAQSPGLKTAKERLGHALWKRGYFPPRCRAS